MKVVVDKKTIDDFVKRLSDNGKDPVKLGILTGKRTGQTIVVEDVYIPNIEPNGKVDLYEFLNTILEASKKGKVVGLVEYDQSWDVRQLNMSSPEPDKSQYVSMLLNKNGVYRFGKIEHVYAADQ